MTLLYLIVLGLAALAHHSEWHKLHPWTLWFAILIIVAIIDSLGAASRFVSFG
ncbi:MAG TPA: hypothetical protein VKX16_17285 [Chloroflexota bacterium]|nr:hypothetical protein [Chloroflexota bacterium]